MATLIARLKQRLNQRTDSEHEQALIRVAIISSILVHYIIYTTWIDPDYVNAAYSLWAVALVLFGAALLFLAIVINPNPSPVRRVAGIAYDVTTLTIGMFHLSEVSTPLYVVLLWIVFGNGLRFGQRYLLISSAASFMGFLFVILYSDYWADKQLLGGGLLLGLVLLPLYVSFLLRRLVEARQVAEEASRSKGFFLANLSHEFRTSLNAIIGYSEMIREEAQDKQEPEIARDIERIYSSGRHMLNLINNVLDVSKIEAGKLELLPEDISVDVALDEVIQTIRPFAEQNENRVEIEVEGQLGNMRTDQTKLKQILLNLLNNAAKFTHNGVIKLSARRQQGESGRMVFRVIDNGIGMNPEQLNLLFSDFTQASADISRVYGGTGLGLSISRRLARLMGGDITVSSHQGMGTTFTIDLPASLPDPSGL